MKCLKRLLWGDNRDHRLIKVEMPPSFPAYVSPPPSPVFSMHEDYRNLAMAQQARLGQLGSTGVYGSGFGQSAGLGLLGGMGSALGNAAALGARRRPF